MTAKTSAHHQHHHHKKGTARGNSASSASAAASPISESSANLHRTSGAGEPRRANKPLMEKRRRARINQSLAVLKTLILDSAKSDNTKHSKLEKADILELTVRHFQRHRNLDTPGINKYKSGYADCVREVQRYLDTPDAQTMSVIDAGIRQRLLRHLENCVSEIDTDISPTPSSVTATTVLVTTPTATPIPSDVGAQSGTSPVQAPYINQLVPVVDSSLTSMHHNRHLSKPSPCDYSCSNGSCDDARSMPPDKQKVRLEADSSTAEEINNNGAETNYSDGRIDQSAGTQMPGNLVKMYDGNFVFVLPAHYLQLAAALGINFNVPMGNVQAEQAMETENIKHEQRRSPDIDACKENGEKPLDFSKNNDNNEMWRPW